MDGHDSVYARFTRDRTYALRMIEAGYDQRTMRQWDCLIQAILPNPGRSHSQRRVAQGSSSRDPTGTLSSKDLRPARFVFFDEDIRNYQGENEIRMTSTLTNRLYRTGLVGNTPVAIAWFGSFFSISEFSRLAAKSKEVLTFGAENQPLNLTSPNALLLQLQSYAAKDLSSMQDSAKQSRYMAESNRGTAKGKGKSKDKGAEQGKPRSEPYGKGGYGKGGYGRDYYQRRWY